MEEVNSTEETSSQPSTAPTPSELTEGQVDPAPLVPSSSSHGNSQGNQSHQRIDQDEQNSSSYKASEIAARFIEVMDNPKSHVDTAAPIDSVKGAVSKFGGILDWRERRMQLQDEIDKVQLEVTKYQKRSQEAEAGKAQALQELESTASVADELRLTVEKAQARQEAELADLRLRELLRGATSDSESAAATNAELDVVRDRRAAAFADLQSARAELASLEKQRAAAAPDADAAVARARESAAASQEAGKAVADLAAELVALKGELESSHAAHAQAEEKRVELAAAFEQDKSQWQSELEEADQEAKKLRDELMAACEVEMKAEAASELLASLKAELLACTTEETTPGDEEENHRPTKAVLEKTKKELEHVKESIEKAKDEAKCLRAAAASMRDDLEREKADLAALQRKKGLSAASIASLEEELNRATYELGAAQARAQEVYDKSKMAEHVGEARREAVQAKGKARSAREEVANAREEVSVARAAVAAMEWRLEAVTREILAANTSEEMAAASASALLQESKASRKVQGEGSVEGGVTLTVEEYDELSRRAREMEDAAGTRVIEAVKLIKEAKDAEVRSLEKLKKVAKQTEQRRQALQAATEEAEEAEFAKLSAERELRQWRAEQEQQPRTGLAEISVLDHPGGDGRGNPHILSPRGYMPRTDVVVAAGAAAEAEARHKKTTFFPRMVMFLARKKAQAWK